MVFAAFLLVFIFNPHFFILIRIVVVVLSSLFAKKKGYVILLLHSNAFIKTTKQKRKQI